MRVVIADDEPLARARLRALLSEQPGMTLVGEVADGEQLLALCRQQAVDVVLLDVAMPGLDGVQTARRLLQLRPPPAVVFCTAYDHYALPAFDAAAVDYLLKPVRPERLAMALQRATVMLAGRTPVVAASAGRDHLYVRRRGTLRLIALDRVRYLQADEKYVVIHHADGEDLIEQSLKALEEAFPDRLLRIHRNCLVARAELSELRRDADGRVWALLRSVASPLEVSRRCLSGLREYWRQPLR